MYKQANPAYAQLLGDVGEVSKLADRKGIAESTKITPELLLEYLEAPCTEITLAPLRRWLETVPAVNSVQVLDLYYIEQKLGCWAMVWPYAQSHGPGFIIFPMRHRKVVERIVSFYVYSPLVDLN